MSEKEKFWRRCGTCKKEIPYGAIYQACSVSTCRKTVYCSVDCWDEHVPVMNHRTSWAEENRAPTTPVEDGDGPESRPPRRIKIPSASGKSIASQGSYSQEVLVISSRLKGYVKDKHGMNTAANVMEHLSSMIRIEVDKAIEVARAEGRKTLMDRDFS
ncbi:MAG: hypothetical protein HN353_00745 [Bdellovibrionales bacterium]|nr:hypothetical protein [Bdellovibrionales bacterium]MBT3524686.1 hypothetical protein [Bdellovibrionales bacterium]MBT7766226.1 hypothetical protein [Bdellovibrionales bacterium]